MAPYSRILVPLALGPLDRELVNYAAMICRWQSGGRVDLVHVSPKPWREMNRIWKEMESEDRGQFEDGYKSVELRYHVLEGDLTDRLLEVAVDERSDLILLGHQLGHGGQRALARRLAMAAPCSVWMVPEGNSASLNRVIAPVDFSQQSADALDEAIGLAFLSGLRELTALHVYFDRTTVTYEEWPKVREEREQDAFKRFLAGINTRGVTVKSRCLEAPSVAHAIRELCEEEHADLVVMSTRGRSRAASVLLGSETEQVIIESKIPVLAVKHFGARKTFLEVLLDKKFRQREESRFG
ncbi:MAG: universal stress protein [Bryobacteraceae bacterium]